MSMIQIYWFGPLLGAVFAGAVYDVIFSTKSSFRRVRACLLVFHHPRDSHVIDPPVDVIDYVGTGQQHHQQQKLMSTRGNRTVRIETGSNRCLTGKMNDCLKNDHDADDDAEEDDSDEEYNDNEEITTSPRVHRVRTVLDEDLKTVQCSNESSV